MRNPLTALFAAPVFRRIGFHAKRIGGQLDRHFFTSLLTAIVGFVVLAAIAVTLLEPERFTLAGFGSSFYWAVTTVIGSGDPSYVSSPGGFLVGWLLAFFGVAIVAAMTGADVGFDASMTNPPADFRLEPGDDAVVVAESLGELQPLALQQA